MKRLVGLLVVGMVLAAVSVAAAGEPAKALVPIPEPAPAAVVAAAPVELFPCVVYKDVCNIAPCAVPKVVQVLDPCQPCCCDPCCGCPKRCVNVQICVPPPDPCACCPCEPKVHCGKDGKHVRYDYGKYAVEITVKKGRVVVDYDD